jgi:type IV fimbrial biogenesis protein FimT
LAGLNYARSEAAKRRENIVFSITNESPWRYEVYPESDVDDVLRKRAARDDRTSVTAGSVEFNPLGRRADCMEWNQCTFAVSWGDGARFSGVVIGLTGRVSKTDALPEPEPEPE